MTTPPAPPDPALDYEIRSAQLRLVPYQHLKQLAMVVAEMAERCAKTAMIDASMPGPKRVLAVAAEREGLSFLVEQVHSMERLAHLNAESLLPEKDMYRLGVRTRNGREWLP